MCTEIAAQVDGGLKDRVKLAQIRGVRTAKQINTSDYFNELEQNKLNCVIKLSIGADKFKTNISRKWHIFTRRTEFALIIVVCRNWPSTN